MSGLLRSPRCFVLTAAGALAVSSLLLAGCQKREEATIRVDGSSTVFPITKAVAVQFGRQNPDASVEIGVSGTGGGFKKFLAGETDVNNASRPIKESEREVAREQGIDWIELKVAVDGISVVVNNDNTWCNVLTVAQLKALWEPGSKVNLWSDLNPEWPPKPIKLYGPDADSGTFEYFTEVVVQKKQASRTDFDPNSDDNVLVTGVKGNRYALGYFGFAYYVENENEVKAVPIAAGDDVGKAVFPTIDSIESGEYAPLSRPLFIYVNTASLRRPEVVAFLRFYLEAGQEFVKKAKYVPLRDELYRESKEVLEAAVDRATATATE